jgi:hypothetical protein
VDSTTENQKSEGKPLTIRQLYPELTEEQLQEAEENLHRYFAFALKMHERNGGSLPSSLDAPALSSRMKERSNNSLKI